MALSKDFSERRPYNAVTDFVDANVERGLGNKIAFIDPDRSLSYGDLQDCSVRFANALRALGLEHERRVALLLNDTVDYPVAFWGAIRAGAIAIPLNDMMLEVIPSCFIRMNEIRIETGSGSVTIRIERK